MTLKFESTLIPAEATRRVVIELPESRAQALANAINVGLCWSDTDVEDELCELYDALRGEA